MNTTRKERFIQKATRLTVKVLLFSLLLSLFLYACIGAQSSVAYAADNNFRTNPYYNDYISGFTSYPGEMSTAIEYISVDSGLTYDYIQYSSGKKTWTGKNGDYYHGWYITFEGRAYYAIMNGAISSIKNKITPTGSGGTADEKRVTVYGSKPSTNGDYGQGFLATNGNRATVSKGGGIFNSHELQVDIEISGATVASGGTHDSTNKRISYYMELFLSGGTANSVETFSTDAGAWLDVYIGDASDPYNNSSSGVTIKAKDDGAGIYSVKLTLTHDIYGNDITDVDCGTYYSSGSTVYDGYTNSTKEFAYTATKAGKYSVTVTDNVGNDYTFEHTVPKSTITLKPNYPTSAGVSTSDVVVDATSTGNITISNPDTFICPGYAITGWSTSSTATSGSNTYNVAAMNASYTLYAVWVEAFTLIYENGIGDSVTPAVDSAPKGTTMTVYEPPSGYTKAGHYFAGWKFRDDGTTIQPGATITAGENATSRYLDAIWNPITYSITYQGNGNTGGSTATQTGLKGGEAITVQTNGFTKDDGFFMNWYMTTPIAGDVSEGQQYDAATMAGVITALQSDIKDSEVSITLKAIWLTGLEFGKYASGTGQWGSATNPYVIRTKAQLNSLSLLTNGALYVNVNSGKLGSIDDTGYATYTDPVATDRTYSGCYFELAADVNTGGTLTDDSFGNVTYTVATNADWGNDGEKLTNITDGNVSTKFCDHNTAGFEFQYNMSSEEYVDSFTFTNAADAASYPKRIPEYFSIQGSRDGSTWTTICTVRDSNHNWSASGGKYTIQLDKPGYYRYFKVYVRSRRGFELNGNVNTDYVGESNADPLQFADLSFSGATIKAGGTHTPIGKDTSHAFNGHFNGNGHTVTLAVSVLGNYAGLFGYMRAGSITNLTVNGEIFATGNYVGALVGHTHSQNRSADPVIEDITTNATVTGQGNYVGGIIGCAQDTTLRGDLNNTGKVVGVNNVGGITGSHFGANSSNATILNSGAVSGTNNVGGYAGEFNWGTVGGTITNSGRIVASNNYAGGIIGYNHDQGAWGNGTFTNNGVVIGIDYVGGIVGAINIPANTGQNSYAGGLVFLHTSQVVGRNYVGGIFGYWTILDKSITAKFNTNDTNTPVITGNTNKEVVAGYGQYIGGFFGRLEGTGTINFAKDSAMVGEIDCGGSTENPNSNQATGSIIGGVVGYNNGTNLNFSALTSAITRATINGNRGGHTSSITLNSATYTGAFIGGIVGFNNGNITGPSNGTSLRNGGSLFAVSKGNYLGGIVGFNYAGEIKDCKASASFSSSFAGDYVGGVVGYVYGGTISGSTSFSGTVYGVNYVGGLVGKYDSTSALTLSNITNANTITSTGNYVGGFFGWINTSAAVNLTNLTNTGAVTGNDHVGGIAGQTSGSGTLSGLVNSSAITGANYVGGLFGELGTGFTGILTASTNNATVSGTANYIGGVVGIHHKGTIQNCVNKGAVNGVSNIGGITGRSATNISNTAITVGYCMNNGTITASNGYAGGIIGYYSPGSASLSATYLYNFGSVSGSTYGGIIGINTTSYISVTNSWSFYTSVPASADLVGRYTYTGKYVANEVGATILPSVGMNLHTDWTAITSNNFNGFYFKSGVTAQGGRYLSLEKLSTANKVTGYAQPNTPALSSNHDTNAGTCVFDNFGYGSSFDGNIRARFLDVAGGFHDLVYDGTDKAASGNQTEAFIDEVRVSGYTSSYRFNLVNKSEDTVNVGTFTYDAHIMAGNEIVGCKRNGSATISQFDINSDDATSANGAALIFFDGVVYGGYDTYYDSNLGKTLTNITTFKNANTKGVIDYNPSATETFYIYRLKSDGTMILVYSVQLSYGTSDMAGTHHKGAGVSIALDGTIISQHGAVQTADGYLVNRMQDGRTSFVPSNNYYSSSGTGYVTLNYYAIDSDYGIIAVSDRNGDGKVESEWGSVDNPYVISHWIHLLRLSEIVNQISAPINSVQGIGAGNSANARSKDVFYTAYLDGTIKKSYFLVTANITMPDHINFKPIGGWSAIANQDGATTFYSYENNASNYFGGVFDGNFASGAYATIRLGNQFSALNGDYVGLFGVMKGVVLNGTVAHAEVKNVDVLSADASNAYYNVAGAQYVGVVVGKAQEYVLIDRAYANAGLNNSNKVITVSGTNFVGSVVGHLGLGSEMYGEYVNYAKVSGSSYVGGVIGQIMAGAGRQGTAASERENYTFGEFEDSEGNVHKSIMDNRSTVSGTRYVGGIVGGMVTNGDYSGVMTIVNPTYFRNVGNVNATSESAGGFVGITEPNIAIRLTNTMEEGQANWSYNGSMNSDETTISSLKNAGGLFGELGEGGHQITSVFSTAIVNDRNGGTVGENMGGLVGHMKGGSFKNCFVTIPGNTEEVNTRTSRVLGNKNVGGLVGWMYAGTLDTCYAQGFKYDNNVTVNKGGVVGVANTVTIKNTWTLYLTANPTYQSVPANTYGKYILAFYPDPNTTTDGAMSATMDELLVFAGLLDDASIAVARATGGANEIKAEKGHISIGITLPEVTSNISNFDTAVQVVFYDGSGYQEAYADAFEEAANDSTLNNLFIRLNSSNDSFIIAKTGVRFGSIADYNNDREWEEKFISLYGGSYMVDVINPVDNTGAGTYDGQLVTKYSNYTHTLISDDIGNSRETLSNLFDGDVTTKFCYGTTSQTFVIDLSTSVYVSGYRWATANDTASNTSRNPNKFVIEGSNNNSSWTPLLTESNNDWTTENFTWVHGSAFSNPGSYRYIRVTVSSSGSLIQLSEFRVGHFVNTSRQITFNFKKYSEVAPRIIDTLDDWKAFALDVQNSGTSGLNQYVKLAADITVPTKYSDGGTIRSGLAGLESTDNINAHNFRGIFDGDGYTITVDIVGGSNTSSAGNVASSLNELGLFPQAMNATFQNLTIAGSITSTGSDIGAFVGIARGPLTFYNCTNKATVKSTGTSSHNVGGLVGTANNQNVTFIGCVNQGNITGDGNFVMDSNNACLYIDYGTGGILGSTGTGTGSTVLIDSCRNSGTITADAAVGGIVGACRAAAQITNCGNTGNCTATKVGSGNGEADCAVGGIVGAASQNGGANIYACYNSGTIVAYGNKAGGIMGTDAEYTSSGKLTQIYHCYNTGDVYAGGLTSHTDELDYGVQAGGIIGVSVRTEIFYCYNLGKVTSNGMVRYGGTGVVGEVTTPHARAGGIAGMAVGADSNSTTRIYRCYNAGEIVIGVNVDTTFLNAGNLNQTSYAAGIIGYINESDVLSLSNKDARVSVVDCFSIEYQVRRLHKIGDKNSPAQDAANNDNAHPFNGAVSRTKTCATSGNYLSSIDELTCTYDTQTGLIRPKNDAVYSAFGENGKAPTILNSYQGGTVNAAQLRQGLDGKEAGGYVFVYGCLPQLAVFALDTQDGTAMTSQNYVKDKMGIYHLEKAGSENNPYVIKDGIDLMGINALAQASAGLDGKYLEFANGENNLSGDICKEINMPSTAAGEGTAAADTQNYYKFYNGRTNGYSEGKSYHLFKKGAYCSVQAVGDYVAQAEGVPATKYTYARTNWKNANDYWNGSSWVAGGDLTNANIYPIGRYYSIKHVWSNSTGGPYNSAFKGHIDGSYDGTNPVVISNVKIALSNVESHSYTGYPTTYEYRDDKGNVINNNSDGVNSAVGLFGFVEDATIANIAVTGTIKAYGSGAVSAGVVGKALGNTSIIGVQAGSGNASLTVTSYTGADAHVGGIVGMADSGASGNRLTIADSVVANATVNSHKGAVGGIVSYVVGDGISSFIDITGCHVQKATLSTADNYFIGGIIGIQGTKIIDKIAVGCALSIRDCKVGDTSKKAPATANVIIRGYYGLGGIIAYATAGANVSASFEDCYVYGDVLIEKTSETNNPQSTYLTSIGGITGYVNDSTDSFVTFRGDMEFYGTINLGRFTGVKNVGGVVGYMGTSARMEQSFVEVYGTINATGCANSENIGGFAGISKGVCLDGAFAIAPTLTTDVSTNVGGFIGLNDGDTYITRTSLIYTSRVSWTDADGDDFPDQNEITITGAGSVVAKEKVGGFIGANNVGCELHMGAAEYKGAIYGEDGDLAYIELGSSVDGLRYIGGFLGYNAGEIFGEYCDVINTGSVGTASVPTEGYETIDCIGGVFGDNTATGEINIGKDATFINSGQVGLKEYDLKDKNGNLIKKYTFNGADEENYETDSANQEFVGGIIGVVLGSITNNGSMQNMGDVFGYQYVGGAIGGLVNGTISGELSNGNGVVIHATAESEALVASDEAVSTAATGSSSVKAVVNVGGVIGVIMQDATISGATLTNYGSVTSTGDSYNVSNLGGAIGLNYGIIENSEFYNYGEITAKNFAGGAIGVNDGTIRNSDFVNSATIHFTGDTALGGAVGYITNNYTTHGSTAYYPDNPALSAYEYNDSTRNFSTVTDSYFGYESIDNSKVVVQATGVDPYAFNANDDAESAFAAQGGLGGVFGAINSDDMTASGGWSGNTFFVYGDVYGGVFKSNASNGGVYVDDATTPFTNQNFGGTVQAVGGVIGAIEVSYISIHNMLIYKSNVGGLRRVGGVVGFNGNANSTEGARAAVDHCYNVYGNVIGTSTSVSKGTGSQIYVDTITVNYEDVGGIVGYIPTDPNVVTGEAYDPKTNASYWIKSYANELLQNSNPDNITETLDKASTWTEFLSYADYSNNVDELDANGNPIHLVGEIDTWDKYFAANPGLYIQNANGDWGSYSEESVKIKYNTGTKETGYYYLFADDSASFTGHAEGVVVDHNHTPVKLSAPYASNESLNYWLIIVGSAKRAQADGTYYDEYESDSVHENVGGAVKAGYIYSTAYASTKNGFYLYVKDQGNATTLNGEGDKIYISSDADNAGNIMIFYKEVVAYNNFVYNGYERYAQLVDVNFSEDQPTEGVGEENIDDYFGKYHYTFNGTVAGKTTANGIGINRATNAGSHEIKATIWTVDSKGKPVTLGSVDSTIDGADQYKWSIKKRNIEVDFDTQSPHIVDTKNNEDPADAFRFDNTFSHYIKFTVSNIAIDVDEDVSSGEKIMAIINKIVTPKYSFNGGSESSLVDLKEGSVVPEIQVPQNSEVANVSFYAVGANSTSGSKNDTDNCYVYATDEYKNVGSVKLYSATYIVYFKKAGAHKVSVTATDTNHRASSSDNKTVSVDKRELKLEVNTSENSWKTNYIFDGGKNWQGVTSVVISNFIAGTLDDKTDYVTTTGSTAGLSNGKGNKNAGKHVVIDTSANTITVNFYANDAANYNAVVELAALFKDSYYFVFKGTAIGTLSSGTEPSKWNAGWTINPYTIVAQADGISGGTYVYDGTIHAIKIASGDDSITGGVDGAPEKVEVSIDVNMTDTAGNSISQACNVGTYTATIDAAAGVAGAGKVIAESSSKSSASIKNYVIDFSLKEGSNLTATITITPCPIEVSWKDVFNNKAGNGYVYDGNTNGPVIGSLTVGGESKTFSNGKAEGVTKDESISLSVGYTVEKNASNNVKAYTKDFKVTGTNEVGDALASNYTFVGGAGYDEGEDRVEKTFSRAKSIVYVDVTVKNIPDKVFDNTTNVGTISYDHTVRSTNSSKTCSVTGRSLTGKFSDANVGSNKTVNLTFSASLSDTTNFEWAGTKYNITGVKTADITARPLYIQLNNGANGSIYKTYDNSTEYASVTSDSGDEKQSTGIQWRTGRGILVSNFCTSDITVTASFLEVDQKNRSDFNAYVNDIYKDTNGEYVIGGTSATDTFYKMLRFVLSGEGSTNYYIAEITDKGGNVLKSNANTGLTTLDLVDTAEDNINVVIKKASVKVNYSNTSQSYANADNTYNTNWNAVTGQISTSKYKNLADVHVENGWMYVNGVNGEMKQYDKYTRIAGSATSTRLGATLTSDDGKHLCLTLRNQPTLIIGYFVEKNGGYEIGSMAGLLIASEYFKNNFNTSDEKGYDYVQTEIDFSEVIKGHSPSYPKVPESVYTQIANNEITTWEQLLAAVPEYDPRGYTHGDVEYKGMDIYLDLLTDIDDVTDEYLKAALQSQLDSFEFVYELINASGEAVESETLHLVWWVPVEVKDTRSYNSFILVDNIDAILTDADIDMLTGAFGSNYGVGKAYLPNVVFAEAGSVVIFNGPIFDYSTDKDGNKIGFNGIFDGDGYSIDHLTITYVVTETSHNNIGMFAEVSGNGSQVTAINLRNLNIQVIDTTASAKVINVGGVAGKFAASTVMEDVTVHGTISVKSTLGTVYAGGVIGSDSTGYVDGGVSKVIDGAIVVATVRAEGAIAVAGGVIGIMNEVNTTLTDIVSLSEVYAKGANTYANGFVGQYAKLVGGNASYDQDGIDYTPLNSTGKTSAYLDSVFTITAGGTYTRIAGGVSYDTLYDGSSTAYVDGIYLNAIEVSYGTYDMVGEKNAIAGKNTTGSMRLRDIVDTYVLGYELSAYTSGTGDSAIATYRKSTTSKCVGTADGTDDNRIGIAYQQHLNLIRMFNYMNFTLNRDVTMYTGYKLYMVDEAFTGTIEVKLKSDNSTPEVNVRSSESNKDFVDDDDDNTTYPQFFAYQDVNFTWLKKD